MFFRTQRLLVVLLLRQLVLLLVCCSLPVPAATEGLDRRTTSPSQL